MITSARVFLSPKLDRTLQTDSDKIKNGHLGYNQVQIWFRQKIKAKIKTTSNKQGQG